MGNYCERTGVAKVALRKESVDRNFTDDAHFVTVCESLSARRAWIEIRLFLKKGAICAVALRKESVDRNGENSPPKTPPRTSLSARRAWIEIRPAASRQTARKCRSPQGERG